jgi:hypothetical protein
MVMNTIAPERLPAWVTVVEASIITGLSEEALLDAAESGLLASAPLAKGRRGGGVLMLKVEDLQRAGFLGGAAVGASQPPPSVEPAAPVPPTFAPPTPPPDSTATEAAAPPSRVMLPTAAPPLPADPVLSMPAPVARTIPVPTAAPTPTPVAFPTAAPPPPAERIAFAPTPYRRERSWRVPRLSVGGRKPLSIVALCLAALVAAAALYVVHRPPKSKPTAAAPPAPPSSVAWAVRTSGATFISVIGTPAGGPAAALAVPENVVVDLPDGLSTLGAASTSGPATLAAIQAVIRRHVEHDAITSDAQLSLLIDRVGGIKVDLQTPLQWLGHTLGPGSIRLSGPEVLGYLAAATASDDRIARWEDVLSGLFGTSVPASAWQEALGPADQAAPVAAVFASARGAQVLEMPTTAAVGGGLQPNQDGLPALLTSSFGSTLGPLIRIVVVNGSGRPGVGAYVSAKLASAGFWVVSAQNATRFNVRLTKIVAANNDLIARAEEVAKLLGVGKTYVSGEPTGAADITILAGRDLRA